MASVIVQLDGDALQQATAQAIVGVLTPEVKAKILEDAVQTILRPSGDSWNRQRSPLEIAFERAVDKVANDEAKRICAEDPVFQARIKDLLRLTADKILNADVDKLAGRMADAFVASMRRE